jgi:hypothetical protein
MPDQVPGHGLAHSADPDDAYALLLGHDPVPPLLRVAW